MTARESIRTIGVLGVRHTWAPTLDAADTTANDPAVSNGN
jgi:hypothetical protein